MERTGRIFHFLANKKLDCVIIKDVCAIRYLTGFTGDSSLLYADNDKAVLVTDGRYVYQARQQVKYCQVLEYKAEHADSIWEAVAAQVDGNRTVGFDADAFLYRDMLSLQQYLRPGLNLVPVSLKELRMVKDDQELKSLWQATKIADEAYSRMLAELKPGMTEKTLAAHLEYYMRSLGSEGVSFPTIIASGYRSALPHGLPTDKEVQVGDFVTFDFGAVYNGYHSDCTRTVVLGMANSWHKEIYTIVEEAQYRGLKNAKPGITGAELDAIVRDYITSRGYGKNYIHGLGHGVGLEIHELPNINKRGDIPLKSGMTFTIEPGIYIPDKGGVRIEDTVVLTNDGARVLSGLKKQLLEIVD
jgi:Xaa-Pro aminopeptidase